jgi:hypothetical protein
MRLTLTTRWFSLHATQQLCIIYQGCTESIRICKAPPPTARNSGNHYSKAPDRQAIASHNGKDCADHTPPQPCSIIIIINELVNQQYEAKCDVRL